MRSSDRILTGSAVDLTDVAAADVPSTLSPFTAVVSNFCSVAAAAVGAVITSLTGYTHST